MMSGWRIWIAPKPPLCSKHIRKKRGHTIQLRAYPHAVLIDRSRYWIATSRSFNCSLDNALNSAGKRPLPI